MNFMFSFSYPDCSSYYFKKYQDLPTRGAHAVEHFTIDGSLFLAFANFKSDTAEKYNTDSFIYKFNDLTGKFFLYQTIGTHGGHDVEYFSISGKHYLAVANAYNGTTSRMNSVIYLWNGTSFFAFQNIATNGGWKNNMFEKFQEIATEGCRASAAFVINNESYIALANAVRSASSVVYKRAGMHFVKLQNLQKHRAMDIKSFFIIDDVFLAIASQPESYINKWNGSQFVQFKTILTSGARALHPFVMCGQTFLGLADQYRTKTVLYQFSALGQFTKYQELLTFGAIDMTSFEYKGHTYLAIANYGNNQRNIESTVYKGI
ncbi:unnamed protein product [Porites evermanni]|uniref:Uncharacterized protein n=1 Tax=Porites evermanni TaxID=104178 RepID=A0ABN8STK0_9CNID|nr:unnamed protein product [Porites evermanni]